MTWSHTFFLRTKGGDICDSASTSSKQMSDTGSLEASMISSMVGKTVLKFTTNERESEMMLEEFVAGLNLVWFEGNDQHGPECCHQSGATTDGTRAG